jgi:cytochrome c oxidase cbb3-type subunit 2
MKTQPDRSTLQSGWRGIALVAITYVYFLIFAQFAFLQRLEDLGLAQTGLRSVMGAMAAGGMLVSWFAYRAFVSWSVALRMQLGFAGCALGALLTLVPLNIAGAAVVALLIGVALGWLTVTLVSNLNLWMGDRLPLVQVGVGTGLGYFLCNVPSLFDATPSQQAVVAALMCGMGIVIVMRPKSSAAAGRDKAPVVALPTLAGVKARSLLLVVTWFTALIWLDSAAFSIIQNAPALKADTWSGDAQLWRNAFVHLGAAIVGGWMLTRRGLETTIAVALGGLAIACVCLGPGHNPKLAALLYPIAVSVYSAALVGYPAFLSGSTSAVERTRAAGRIYAVAGWLGSGMGIGMAQDLGRIPMAFVAIAVSVVLAPWLWRWSWQRQRELICTALLMLFAVVMFWLMTPQSVRPSAALTAAERGRRVYVAEGCLHCHSQYVRPGTHDELWWGPASDPAALLKESPPLIGNRRQGPDLANVGARRTPAWLKAHFLSPRQLSAGSPMPSYAHLFADGRGDDLVAYVSGLGQTNVVSRLEQISRWQLPESAIVAGRGLDGTALLARHCATCHEPEGAARKNWPVAWTRVPPDLKRGPFTLIPPEAEPKWRLNRAAEIIKFGVPFMEMPGHEYLPDDVVAALALAVVEGSQTNSHENPAR